MPGNNPTIAGGGFHHLSMRVADLDASIAFYTEGLGCALRTSWGQGDRRTVLLDTGDGNYLELSGGGASPPQPGSIIVHFALRTTDCDQAIEAARAAGAEVTVEPRDVTLSADPPIPARIAFCKGPDGELIEFFQNEAT
ncbi:MAG: VOC family protein [Anaerolineae bacterium]|jgi:glyoxylase I family protein